MSKDKGYVNEIFTRSKNKSTPILLKFQNGNLKNANKDSTVYFPAIYEPDKNTKRAVVVTSGNIYCGPISKDSEEIVDTYICIRNKTTNKIRILPIDQAKLINNVYAEKDKNQFALLSKDSSRETAMRLFGGRRDLRFLNNRERNNVCIDVLREQLETTIENSELTETGEAVVSTQNIFDTIRPKFNQEAKNLDNLFNVYDVIPLELIDRLDEEVSVIMNTDIDDIPILSEYLKKLIIGLKTGAKSSQTLLKLKMVLYMDGLLTLLKSRKKNLDAIELSKITEKIENDIRKRFSSPSSLRHERSGTTDEKALCYFLVLGFLLTDDFILDVNMLSTELCMSKAKIAKYGNLLHAVYRSKANSLVLRLPGDNKSGLTVGDKRKKK